MSIYRYFSKEPTSKPTNSEVDQPLQQALRLPSPTGELSQSVSSSSIESANRKVLELFDQQADHAKGTLVKKRGKYTKYSAEDKATIANYAVQHGTSVAIKKFKKEFPDLKWSTLNDWKKQMITEVKKNHSCGNNEKITALVTKKQGRPSKLSDEIAKDLVAYVRALRDAGGTVNSAILIAAATGMVLRRDPSSLSINGGHITLEKDWAKYFLHKIGFVKRKATTKSKVTVEHFEAVKQQYLLDIHSIKAFEEIPDDLLINWDQTGINYVPASHWTMAVKGSKRVEVVGLNDKRQITAVFGASLAGDFLPIQLVYQGKTVKSLPSGVQFPNSWHITSTPNHWCSEATMISYIDIILIPYIREKKKALGLPDDHASLVIFDVFRGQVTDKVLSMLQRNNILYALVPANCTDRLQPLDVSVNKAAKEFLRSKFQMWYAENITDDSRGDSPTSDNFHPVDLKLSVMKPIGARWMIELYDYLKSKPSIIINGFTAAGIH